MDAQQALADLTEISSQVEAAVIFDERGKVAGSTLADGQRAADLAAAAAELLAGAEAVKSGSDGPLNQLEAATPEGSVFVVRDGKTRIAATTAAEPTVGLVFYDLKSALRAVVSKPAAREEPSPATKKPAPKKKPAAAKKPAPRKKKDAS